MSRPPLGDQELRVLRSIIERGPSTVGEVAQAFGVPNGLARTTVKTVMERLEKKGYLSRRVEEGVLRYAATSGEEEVSRGLVERFVEKTLAGSLAPFAVYFARSDRLTEEEISELKRLLTKLEAQESRDD
jgi:predicted transcriptional regulator